MSKFLDVGGIKFRIVGENDFYYAVRAPHSPGAQLVPKLPVDLLLELADLGVDGRRIAVYLANLADEHLVQEFAKIDTLSPDFSLKAGRPLLYDEFKALADSAFKDFDLSRLAELSQDYPRHFCKWALEPISDSFSVSRPLVFDSEQVGFMDGAAGPLGEVFAPSESDQDAPVLPVGKKKKKK